MTGNYQDYTVYIQTDLQYCRILQDTPQYACVMSMHTPTASYLVPVHGGINVEFDMFNLVQNFMSDKVKSTFDRLQQF